MVERSHGYNVSVGYTTQFNREIAPDWLDFCARAQGFDARRTGHSYRYLDLGCGQGFHLCLLAAANPRAEFVGVDFQSEHISHGQELAAAAGLTNVRFIQADFLDLAAAWPEDLGTYDYIVLYGILSWISPELRAAVLQCVAHASQPGTLATFAYNSQPGWLSAVPFQHVAHELGKSHAADDAVDGALTLFRRLLDANARLFDQLPLFKPQLEVLAAQSGSYLAHELLTDHWTPLWHSGVAEALGKFDFSYVGSATAAEALLPHSLPPELSAVILEQAESPLRQDVQDIVINQPFRRDIFCRNQSRPHPEAALDGDALLHLFSAPPEGHPVRFKTTFGGLAVEYGVVADILAALANGPKPVSELMALDNPARGDTRGILLSMLDAGILMVGTAVPGSPATAQAFNAAVARGAAGGMAYRQVAAAATGSGAPVTELDLLLLDTWLSAQGRIDEAALAQGVAERLSKLGRQLQFQGRPVADEPPQIQLAPVAAMFLQKSLPRLRRFGIVQ